MEQEKRSFIHDTINLDEIRKLLGEDYASDITIEEEPPAEKRDDLINEFILDDVEPESDLPEEPEFFALEEEEDVASDPEPELELDLKLEMEPEPEEDTEEEEDVFEIPSFVLMEDSKPAAVTASEPETVDEPADQQTSEEPCNSEAAEPEEPKRMDETEPEDLQSKEEPVRENKQMFFGKKKQRAPKAQKPVQEEEQQKPEKKKTSAAFELYSMLHDVIYLLAAVTLIFVFIVRLVGVQGDSMLPTLHNGDLLLLESNFLYGDNFSSGDVVVLSTPAYEMEGDHPIVKRVIATEGDEVNIDFETGAVYVNGVLLQETYIHTPTNYNWDGEYGLDYPAVVPENCIFVLGDNRNNSMDSRYAPIGMVDERCVLGKVLLIALPGQTVDGAGNVIDPREWGRIGLVS